VGPVPDPLLRKSGSAWNLTWDLCICSEQFWSLWSNRGGLTWRVSAHTCVKLSLCHHCHQLQTATVWTTSWSVQILVVSSKVNICNLFWLFCTTWLLWPWKISFSGSGIWPVWTQLWIQPKHFHSVYILYYMLHKLHLISDYSRIIFSLHWPVLMEHKHVTDFYSGILFFKPELFYDFHYKKWLCILS
jgi:hypothetical protein